MPTATIDGREYLVSYAIYFRPLDHPRHVVLREWICTWPLTPGGAQLFDSIDEARAALPPGMVRFDVPRSDCKSLVEEWL